MKNLLICALVTGLAFAVAPSSADAKRLGSGKSYGMQRNAAPDKPAQGTPTAPAATPNAPAAAAVPAAGAAAAAAPKRSWMGPLAGLAAGLGIAALLSHFGLGEGVANFLMLALLALAAVFVIRFLMRRFAGGGTRGLSYAAGGASGGSMAMPAPLQKASTPGAAGLPGSAAQAFANSPGAATGAAATSALAAPAALIADEVVGPRGATSLPASFDTAAFERIAKMIFIRMQAANDSADLNDLRSFTTPELYAALKLDLQDRGAAQQTTDVVTIEAKVLDYAEEEDRQIVSVHFQGLLREEAGAEAAPIDEVWHLAKPLDGSRAWAIAGVQQRH